MEIAARYGWTQERVESLSDRYGSEIDAVLALVHADPELGKPLQSCDWYIGAEVAFACRYEGALHLEDIFIQRVRLNSTTPDRGIAAIEETAAIAAPILGWDEEKAAHEKDNGRHAQGAASAAQPQYQLHAFRLSDGPPTWWTTTGGDWRLSAPTWRRRRSSERYNPFSCRYSFDTETCHKVILMSLGNYLFVRDRGNSDADPARRRIRRQHGAAAHQRQRHRISPSSTGDGASRSSPVSWSPTSRVGT
ncbi:glycerol-3-phosphate dehydrogenase C-terminal domain-containing protein [Propioniciclava flava]